MANSQSIRLGSNFYLCQSDLAKFFEYFGQVEELSLFTEPGAAYEFLVELRYTELKSHHQLLSWPFPLLVQGVPLQHCGEESAASSDQTLDRIEDLGDHLSLFSEPEDEPCVCLKVSRIPETWEAFDLLFKLNGKHPCAAQRAMVSNFTDIWGNKQGIVEIASPTVAEMLMLEGESVLDGNTIEFTYADIDKIEAPRQGSLESFTMFPWLPRPMVQDELDVDEIWTDLFSPPLAEINDLNMSLS